MLCLSWHRLGVRFFEGINVNTSFLLRQATSPFFLIFSERNQKKTGLKIRPVSYVGEIKKGLLFYNPEFCAAVQGPRLLVASSISRHLTAEADSLNAVGFHTRINKSLANCLGATFTKTAVVFLSAALIGESGNDESLGGILHGCGHMLHFGSFSGFHCIAVITKTDGRELTFGHAIAEEIRTSLKSLRERRARYEVSINPSELIGFFFVTRREGDDGDKRNDWKKRFHGVRMYDFRENSRWSL